MKKMTLIILLILLNIHPSSAKNTCAPEKLNVSCWDCGTNCTANLVDNELIVTGNGTLVGSGWGKTKWYSVRDQIQKVTIGEGITAISDAAFYYIPIKEINLPKTLLSIGREVFILSELTEITLPDSLQEVGNGAFHASYKLDNIIVPTSVISIGTNGFDTRKTVYCPQNLNCQNLGTTIPYSKIGNYYSVNGKMYRDKEHMLKDIEMKRIYTIEEATAAVSGKGKNTFTIRYR